MLDSKWKSWLAGLSAAVSTAVGAAGLGLPGIAAGAETAILAGGCFWCVESDFDSVDGVLETTSGFTGGHKDNPTYKEVTRENTGHLEAVQITFDPATVSFRELLDKFWRSIDPIDDGGQFCDRGHSYTTAVFVLDEKQREIAEASKAEAQRALGMTIVTPIRDAQDFYPAEDYHQGYHQSSARVITRFGILKKSDAYKRYRMGCGRDERVKALWGEQAAFAH